MGKKKESFDEASPSSALDKRLELARLKLESKKLDKESRLKEIELRERLRRERVALAAQAKATNIEQMKKIYDEARLAKEMRRRGRLSVEEEHQLALIEGAPAYPDPTPEQAEAARREVAKMLEEYARRQSGLGLGPIGSSQYPPARIWTPKDLWMSQVMSALGFSWTLWKKDGCCLCCETMIDVAEDTFGYPWCQRCGTTVWSQNSLAVCEGRSFPAVLANRTGEARVIVGVESPPYILPSIIVPPGTSKMNSMTRYGFVPPLRDPQTWTLMQLVDYWNPLDVPDPGA